MIATPYVLDPAIARNCVGTVRLPNASPFGHRQRPTILCGDHDPYDFLRQSRLLYGDRSAGDMVAEQQPSTFHAIMPAVVPANGMSSLLRTKRLGTSAKTSSRVIDSFAPLIPDAYCNRSFLPSTQINPYELISSTLHNNEFAPASSLFNFLSHGDRITGASCGTIAIRATERPRMTESNALQTFMPRPAPAKGRECDGNRINPGNAADLAMARVSVQPPPLPSVESLPLSVKTVPDRFTKNVDALKKAAVVSSRSATCAAKYKSILKQSAAAQAAANATTVTPSMPNASSMRIEALAKESNGGAGISRIRCIDVLPMPTDVRNLSYNSAAGNGASVEILGPKSNGSRPKFATMRSGDFRTTIKEPQSSSRLVSGTATTGRMKKVQFNTEPVPTRPKSSNSIAEYDDVCSDSTVNEPFYVNVSPDLSTVNTNSDVSNDESSDMCIKYSKYSVLRIQYQPMNEFVVLPK